jgi:hypothetical protein
MISANATHVDAGARTTCPRCVILSPAHLYGLNYGNTITLAHPQTENLRVGGRTTNEARIFASTRPPPLKDDGARSSDLGLELRRPVVGEIARPRELAPKPARRTTLVSIYRLVYFLGFVEICDRHAMRSNMLHLCSE